MEQTRNQSQTNTHLGDYGLYTFFYFFPFLFQILTRLLSLLVDCVEKKVESRTRRYNTRRGRKKNENREIDCLLWFFFVHEIQKQENGHVNNEMNDGFNNAQKENPIQAIKCLIVTF